MANHVSSRAPGGAGDRVGPAISSQGQDSETFTETPRHTEDSLGHTELLSKCISQPPRKRARVGGSAGMAGSSEKAKCNGSSILNGPTNVASLQEHSSDEVHIGPNGLINREEFIRLLQQSLFDLGFASLSKDLEKVSGIQRQPDLINDFSTEILNGDWRKALALLDQIQERYLDPSTSGSSSSSLASASSSHSSSFVAFSPVTTHTAKFLILQQCFLESLESGLMEAALKTLREELSPLSLDNQQRQRQLHWLATLFMCTSKEDLYDKSGWSGSGTESRRMLLSQLQALLPPHLLLPDNRLMCLVEQALGAQRAGCLLHNTHESHMSLLQDHQCKDQIPLLTTQVLEAHGDEVWHIEWSHSGLLLASASKDKTVRIWELYIPEPHSSSQSTNQSDSAANDATTPSNSGADQQMSEAKEECQEKVLAALWSARDLSGLRLRLRHTLLGHGEEVSFLAFSPDDTLLLSCSNDTMVQLWSVESGCTVQILAKHSASVTTCAWCPDSTRFLTGGNDRNIYMWDIEGNLLNTWKGGMINDLVMTPDGKYLVFTHGEVNAKAVVIHNLETQEEETIQEMYPITSLNISRDGKHLLVNLHNQEIHMWELMDSRSRSQTCPSIAKKQMVFQLPVTKPENKQCKFVIRSCFGGSEENFIVSGHEDSKVYIWHGRTGDLLHVLPGHSGMVNTVSWNPVDPLVFASASDDKTIRLWGRPPSPAGTPAIPPGLLNCSLSAHPNPSPRRTSAAYTCPGRTSASATPASPK